MSYNLRDDTPYKYIIVNFVNNIGYVRYIIMTEFFKALDIHLNYFLRLAQLTDICFDCALL